jgi:hypothetical protein
MASLEEKIKVETQVRELLAQNGLPEPDGVEYGYTCIRLFFAEPKTVLIVDIDEPDGEPDDETDANGEADDRPGPGSELDDETSGDDIFDPEDEFCGWPLDGFGDEHGAGLN